MFFYGVEIFFELSTNHRTIHLYHSERHIIHFSIGSFVRPMKSSQIFFKSTCQKMHDEQVRNSQEFCAQAKNLNDKETTDESLTLTTDTSVFVKKRTWFDVASINGAKLIREFFFCRLIIIQSHRY